MSATDDKLREYKDKRKSGKSSEPTGKEGSKVPGNAFSFQKHDASTLHYDFRLVCDGVLKSWAVPKGPSTDPSEKRLAVQTEDHPLDYLAYEGVIPEGEYGAGTVLLWDKGTYDYLGKEDDPPLSRAIEKGHFKIFLKGEKIRGGYAMTRMNSDKQEWLLVKMDDEEADARRNPVSTEPRSVKSQKKIDEIRE